MSGGQARDSGEHSRQRQEEGKGGKWEKIGKEIIRQNKMENWEGGRAEGEGHGQICSEYGEAVTLEGGSILSLGSSSAKH